MNEAEERNTYEFLFFVPRIASGQGPKPSPLTGRPLEPRVSTCELRTWQKQVRCVGSRERNTSPR